MFPREVVGGPRLKRLALIVTADDFGLGPATSEGIIRAHLEGPVTATSMMVVTGAGGGIGAFAGTRRTWNWDCTWS